MTNIKLKKKILSKVDFTPGSLFQFKNAESHKKFLESSVVKSFGSVLESVYNYFNGIAPESHTTAPKAVLFSGRLATRRKAKIAKTNGIPYKAIKSDQFLGNLRTTLSGLNLEQDVSSALRVIKNSYELLKNGEYFYQADLKYIKTVSQACRNVSGAFDFKGLSSSEQIEVQEFGLFSLETDKKETVHMILPILPRYFNMVKRVYQRAKRGFVTLTDGTLIKKDNAVKINNIWYEKGKEAILLDEKWVIYDRRIHFKDFRTDKWFSAEAKDYRDYLIDYVDGKPIIGFSISRLTDCDERRVAYRDPSGSWQAKPCFNYNALIAARGFIDLLPKYDLIIHKDDVPYIKGSFETLGANGWNSFNSIKPKYLTTDPDMSPSLRKHLSQVNYKNGTDSVTNIISENKPYSFGVELETSGGAIPHHTQNLFNWKAVRDGSVQGAEYVTGVLFGDSGFNHVSNLCSVLSKYTKVDKSCGFHVHIGNCSFSKEFNIYMMLTGYLLEKELFNMMPASRASNTFCTPITTRWLNKEELFALASQKLGKEEYKKVLDSLYARLYQHLLRNEETKDGNRSDLQLSAKVNRRKKHPGGHYGSGHGSARYNWLNLLNSNFIQRSKNLDTLIFPKNNKSMKDLTIDDFEYGNINQKSSYDYERDNRTNRGPGQSSPPLFILSESPAIRNIQRETLRGFLNSHDFIDVLNSNRLFRSIENMRRNRSGFEERYRNAVRYYQNILSETPRENYPVAVLTFLAELPERMYESYNTIGFLNDLVNDYPELRERLLRIEENFGVRDIDPSQLSGSTIPKRKIVEKPDHKSVYTVEFRIHSGTTNSIKVRNWLLICMAIVFFAEERRYMLNQILLQPKPALTLETVLKEAYSEKLSSMLIQYVEIRKKMFSVDRKGSEQEMKEGVSDKEILSVFETIKDLKKECV